MKLLTLLIVAMLLQASTTRIDRVYVTDGLSLKGVVVATNAKGEVTYYYNNKRIDKRYTIEQCKDRPERHCLELKEK